MKSIQSTPIKAFKFKLSYLLYLGIFICSFTLQFLHSASYFSTFDAFPQKCVLSYKGIFVCSFGLQFLHLHLPSASHYSNFDAFLQKCVLSYKGLR